MSPRTWAHSFGPTRSSFSSSTITRESSDGTVAVLSLLRQYGSMRKITFSTSLFVIITQTPTYEVLTPVSEHPNPKSFAMPPNASMNFATLVQTEERQRSFWLSPSRAVKNRTTSSLKPPLQQFPPQLGVRLDHSSLMTFSGKKRVFLKDSWRININDMPREGDSYAILHKERVPNIAECLDSGDIGDGTYHSTQTHLFVDADWVTSPKPRS
jgi:hypothetical protein